MRTGVTILLLLLASVTRAEVFVVTRTLDDVNPGSLRWAINSANGNTPSPIPDTIAFNIPNANTNAQRTIALNMELPTLTSNIVIDGTTQFGGSPTGVGNAKIFLVPKRYDLCNRGLIIENADHVEIYGLGFIGFINSDPTQPADYRDGIYMKNVRDIIIGAPDMGNAFIGCYYGIRHEAIAGRTPPPPYFAANITIQCNSIGPQPPGGGAGGNNSPKGVVSAIYLLNATNVKIGGWRQGEGNEIMAFLNAITVTVLSRTTIDPGDITVVKNLIYPGVLPAGTPVVLALNGITVTQNDPLFTRPYPVVISRNELRNAGMSVSGFTDAIRIVNNNVDCLFDDDDAHIGIGIGVNNCDSAMIGGVDSANIVRNASIYGANVINSKYVTVSRNSIVCSGVQGNNVFSNRVTVPEITELWLDGGGLIRGKTCAECFVEAFNTPECTDMIYNGKNYRATIRSDINGDWSYNAPTSCNSTFTATDPTGVTSRFYAYVDFLFNLSAVDKRNASCGRSNGFIKGIKIYNGVDFHWEDDAGNIISRDTNLINIPAGTYKLVCVKENVLCTKSQTFTISDIQPVIDESNVQRRNPVPGCNVQGAVTGLVVTGGASSLFRYQWFDQGGSGVIVGTGLSLINVPQGQYLLKVSVIADSNCFVTAGPYSLRDVPAPVMDETGVSVTDATCGKANGSIRGIVITDAAASPVYRWLNNNNVQVGNTIDLLNVPPGKYRLVYDDASPCAAMNSLVYTIGNNGLVTIDVTNLEIVPSGCTIVKGAIKNIQVSGADLLEWVDLSNGQVIGSQPDLLTIPTGNYRLRVFDTRYGCADSTADIVVPVTGIHPLSVTSKSVKDETCSAGNGAIQRLVFSPSPVGYTYKWVRNVTDTFATTLDITGLKKGSYTLLAYDSNGCGQVVLEQVLNDHPAPVLNESGKQVKGDVCTQQLGSIQNITVTGGDAPLAYTWYSTPANTPAGQGNALVKKGSGNYYMIVRDVNGCADTSSVIFIPDESPVITPPQYEELYVKRNSTGKFLLLNPAGEGKYEFFEHLSAPVPFLINSTGAFTTPVLMADRDYYVRRVVGSCASSKTLVKVNVIDYSKIFLPNTFTPNNDGVNDLFRIRVYGKIIVDQFAVYNRWGQSVFLSGDLRVGWDGKTGGQAQPPGVYTWAIKGADIDGTPILLRGTVILLR